MSGDEFQSRYSGVMEAMLRSAVAETSQLFQTMVEELKAEMSLIKKENEELRSKCRHFEKKAMMMGDTSTDTATTADGGACSSVFNRLSVVGSPGGACCGESNSNNEPGLGGGPPRSDLTKCDTAIQCDLVPLQVAELYSGTDKALEGEKRRSGSLNPIASEEKHPIDLASSNGEPAALQQDQRDTSEAPDQPDTAGDNEPSCEGGTRSQASGPDNPPVVTPLRLVEKIEPQSQQISASTLIASATENLPGSIHTKEKPDTAGDNETSREGGTRSQASGPENPPLLPLVENMEQKSQQISALTLIASATATEKTATESTLTKKKPDAAGDNESRCKGGTGPENPPDVTPLPLEEKMEPQSQQDSALTLIASTNPPASTSTKEKPVVTPAVEDHVAEVKVIVQPARRRGRPPKVRPPPTDVLVEQGTEKSTSARAEKIEVCRPPAMSVSRRRGRPLKKPRPSTIKRQAEESVESPLHVVPAAHTAANHPESAHIEDEETEDYAPLSPLSDGEQMDEATLPSLEIPSVIETPETSSTEAPKSPSPVPPSSTKFNRSISYPTLEDAMLLIDAMNARTIEGDDATIGNKPSVLRTTSKLAKPQRSPSRVTSQKSDPQSGPGDIEASAAPTLPSPTVTRQTGAKPPTTEPTVAQQPAQQFTLRVNSQSTAGSPNQPSNAVAQMQTLVMIPTTHYAIVSPQNNGPAAMVPVGRRITVVTPKFPRVMSPPKIVVMPRSMSSHVGPRMLLARPQAQLSTAATVSTTVVSAQNTCSPAVTSAGDQPSTQAAAVPTVTLKAMGVTPAQSLSSVPPQATANSSSHSENNARPQMVVLPQQMSVVTPGPHRSNDTTTQTSTANSASTSSLKCDVVTLTKTNAEDKKPVAVPLAQPSPLLSYESSATVSTQTFFDRLKNVVTTLSQKCDNLTSSSKNNSEDSKSVAVPLAQPCPLSTQTSMVNLATTLSQKCDDLASTESNAARSKMTTAPTETCSSLTRLTSSTDAQTAMPLPPVSPKKMVVKLTMLSLPALRKEILKLKRSPVKKQTDASVLQNVPSVVQEVPLAEVESSQTSPAREQDIAPVSVTQPSSKECPITVQVQASVPPKVPTVVQEKPAAAAAAKSSQPTTSADDEESTSTQASFVLKEDTSRGCATAAPDTAIPETPSGAMLRLSSVISKDLGDPHLEMTKVQFLAQLAVTPVAQVQERAPFNSLTDASVGTDDKKGVDENTHLKRRGSHRKPLLNPCKTRLHPAASQMEAQPMPATAKKARSDGDAEPETPAIKTSRRESSSSPRAAHKSSRESIPTGSEKSNLTKNGPRLKKANDAHPPVGIRRSRSSKNTGCSERTTNENEPHGPVSPRSTREGNRKRSNEPTPLGVQRPTLIQDAVRPKKLRLADVKLAAAANTKPSTKAARTKRLPQATGAKKMARAQMFANNAQKRSKKPTDAQTSTSVASAEKSTKADNAKRSAKATTSKAFSKPANVKNVKTARAVKRQRVPKAVKAKTVVKTENEESEIEPEFADQHSQSEGESSQSANNKFCQTGKRIWTVPRTEARGRKRLSVNRLNNNDARSQTPKTPPDTPVRAAAACRPPTPIVSPLQPLAVIGGRLLKNQCGECGRLLGSTAALESHVSLHTFRTPFSCQHCGKSFPDAKCLSRHGRVHRNGRIHVCAECGKGFVYTFGLTKHLQLVHGTVKPFACQFCTKGFHTRRDLDMHTRIHTGEKPFECSLCEKKFKRKVELNVHLRWHNGEKRHWCPYCGKGFLDRNNLKVHKLIHTGEKPHACTLCPKKFTQTGHLKKHLKNVHKV